VAYEVAQQLRADGGEVALLVLFDTDINLGRDNTPWSARMSMKVGAAASTLAFHARAAITQPSLRDFLRYVIRHLDRVGERIRYRYLYFRFRFHGGGQRRDDWRTVAAIQHRMTVKYEPQPYCGDVLLLHRSVRFQWGPRMQQIWAKLVPKHLEIRHIPGDHGDMFDHPQVVVTAENLRQKLRTNLEREVPAIRP
jgi:thioesterase domain-containing protein